MDTTITYIRKLALWKKIVGITLLAMGLYSIIFDFNIFGIVLTFFGFILLKNEGTEINLASKTYRKIISLLCIKIGSWKPLPDVEYISVFATKEAITARALSAETTHREDILALNLFHNRNKKLQIYQTYQLEDAYNMALHIADALLIDILDATRPNDYRWIDKDAYRSTKQLVYVS